MSEPLDVTGASLTFGTPQTTGGTASGSGSGGAPTAATSPGSTSTDDGPPSTTTSADETGADTGTEDDAGTSTGAPVDGCAGARLCEDFEGHAAGSPPGDPWTVQENQSSVTVDETRAFSGTRSVRVVTERGGGNFRRGYISTDGAPVFPLEDNVMWGRAMMWLNETPAGSVHWTHIQGEGEVEGMGFRAFSRYGGQHDGRLMANYETQGISTDCWDHSNTEFPTGAWVCFEWRFNGPNDEMNLFLDGVALDDVTVVGSGEGCIGNGAGGNWYSPVYDTIRLGWEHYQPSNTSHELWIDDVAVGTERIGCPPR